MISAKAGRYENESIGSTRVSHMYFLWLVTQGRITTIRNNYYNYYKDPRVLVNRTPKLQVLINTMQRFEHTYRLPVVQKLLGVPGGRTAPCTS